MKNHRDIAVFIFLIIALTACTVKSTNTKNSASTSPVGSGGGGTGGGGGGGTTTPGGIACDGINNNTGATQCYYKNIPTIQASGGPYGQLWWSSTNFIATSGNSPYQFSTDAVFNVRIIPRSPTAGALSTFNKSCSSYMMYATKLKVQLMMHKNGVSLGEIATLTSPLNTPSNVWHFTVPVTSQPLILEVINVQSDSRCSGFYGSKPSSCTTNPYLDIPINNNGPTECVAFDIQYSTDNTYDLPGSPAN